VLRTYGDQFARLCLADRKRTVPPDRARTFGRASRPPGASLYARFHVLSVRGQATHDEQRGQEDWHPGERLRASDETADVEGHAG